ncbi:winged helix-turn-helix transcriptional regulator [Bradyrhizobium sp. INPA01-394B]|uniref:Winged helix-turn-helix transcriptional regulator n=1 Tax=Bradyrhizobium campsiandrae TaxID=1729892 RepID=A0ABR7U4P3_9BRAD|nr:winged helix-turn-helix transcriptional regulator [Bradyrhizobium campsiandrae]MBC9978538.1 winged helix-turn-helix transcriptional regulator [Bradyrhizobium campsiandrae]
MRRRNERDEVGKEAPVLKVDGLDDLPCTHTALRKAARQLGNLYDEAFTPTGLKATQISLLAQIDRMGGRPTHRALAGELAVRISALTHALGPLVRDGLVRLHTDEHDKRTKHAVLTAVGRKRLDEGHVLWQSVNRRVETVLGSKSAKRIRALADEVSSKDFMDSYRRAQAIGAKFEQASPSRDLDIRASGSGRSHRANDHHAGALVQSRARSRTR